MRALIIGSGSIGQRHAASLRTLDRDAEFVLLRRDAREDDFSRSLDAHVTGDFDAALAARPDLAVIATPSFAHAEAILALLDAGIPCYVEKPAVTTAQDLDRVRRRLRAMTHVPVILMGCNLRFLPSLRRLREAVRAGRIGAVVRATLEAGQWLPDWRPDRDHRVSYSARPEQGGGVIFDLIHEFDMARWLFGEFDRVHAIAAHPKRLEIAAEGVACVLLRGSNTPVVSLGLDYVARRPLRRYVLIGDAGTLTWDLSAQTLTLETQDAVTVLTDAPEAFDIRATYLTAMKTFIDCIHLGDTDSQDLTEGLASAALAIEARRAAGLPC